MNNSIRLLVKGFFDDEIFDVGNDINTDIEDLGRYYDYQIGNIIYQNKKPYAICCGESKQFKDNKPRFCLYDETNSFDWKIQYKLVKELNCFKINYFYLNTFNDFKHIDEDGYGNTQIINNNYNIFAFPAFKYCIELGKNVYLPAIDELQIMLLNKNKLGKYRLHDYSYWSSTQQSNYGAYNIDFFVSFCGKKSSLLVRPFFHIY